MFKLINNTQNLIRVSTWKLIMQGLYSTSDQTINPNSSYTFNDNSWTILSHDYYEIGRHIEPNIYNKQFILTQDYYYNVELTKDNNLTIVNLWETK